MTATRRPPVTGPGARFGRRLLDDETWELLFLILGHLMVFLLSLADDEIVSELVERGHIAEGFAHRAELLIGLGLFVLWGALSVRLAGLLARVRQNASDQKP